MGRRGGQRREQARDNPDESDHEQAGASGELGAATSEVSECSGRCYMCLTAIRGEPGPGRLLWAKVIGIWPKTILVS